jgi:multimeric flavodoxin WrbA
MTNVLGIYGSPRQNGNTQILVDECLKGANSYGSVTINKIIINNLNITPCQECSNMPDDGVCIINDDMSLVYKRIQTADIIIMGSPIFFGSISAQSKIMIDRFQCLWRWKYQINKLINTNTKKGAFICVEASERQDFIENAKLIIKNFFATVDAGYAGELICKNAGLKAAVLKKPDCLKKAYELGQMLVKD